tara:strand:+ start:537 stop:815 length:279 start_codon:yes stop_codon:yes gene_type:complete
MTNQRLRITISPGFATNETIKLLSVYEGRPMGCIALELVEEAIQARLQQQRIPQAVLTYLTGWLQEKFLDNLSEMIKEGDHELAPDTLNSKP